MTDLRVETSDGASLLVRVAGEGPPVVLSHCWTGTMDVWAPVADRLVASGRRVVRYDQRGHGGSTLGRDGHAVERLGDDVLDVLCALDLRSAVLVGHSMGGMAAQSFVIHHPDEARRRVASLVLVATASGGLASRRGRALLRVASHTGVERLLSTRRGAAFVRWCLGRRPPRDAVRLTRDTFVSTPAAVRRDQLQAMFEFDFREACTSISIPTTVVVGTRDLMTPRRHARNMAAAIPEARLVEVAGAGHMLPLEAPDRVADVITERGTEAASVT